MGSSSCQLVPYIIGTLKNIEFSSLLDVGAGFGKWGVLIREYADFPKARAPKDLLRENWRLRIDAIEVFPQFVSEIHRYIYDQIYIGEVQTMLETLGRYDVILMVAVLPHFPEDIGVSVLERLYEHANKALIITIPTIEWPQQDIFENPHEVHYDVKWWLKDFSFAQHVEAKDLPQGERILVLSRERRIKVANPYGRVFTGKRKRIIKKFIGEKAAKWLGAWWRSIGGL